LGDFKLLSTNTIKLGLLFFGLFFIIKTLLGLKQNSPFIKEIDQIIDDLTFDKVDSAEAINKLKLVINGLSFKDIILPQLTKQLKLNREFDLTCDKINEYLKIYISTNNSSEKNIKIKESLLDSIEHNLKILISLITLIEKNTSKILFKLSIFHMEHEDSEDYEIVVKQMKEAFDTNKIKVNEIKSKVRGIKSKIVS
jgi:hypothetical protein